ncbi:phage tail length tape measure family protein [Ectopseudomonas mendocina]|uniref:phage tail length tape measure family protein n=1 Tax=Ectopseudomonas mendocina TaxID=300 RepID=UPI003F097590
MASLKERLIQFVLRGKDELSPEAKKSEEALNSLKDASEQLGRALDNAKESQGLAKALEQTQRAVEVANRNLGDAEKQVTDLRDALSKTPDAAGLQQSLKDAEREASRSRRQLNALTQQLADAEKAAKAAGVNTDGLSDEQQRLAGEVGKARRALDENNAQLKAAQREQARAARNTAEHAASQESLGEMLSSGARKAGAFVAAYLSVNAAIGLVRGGMRLLARGIRAVAMEGSDKQQALAQLEATLASTGRQAEFTTQQLLDMADAMEASSLLTAEQVQSAQARLLSYTDVAAKEFPRALQIIIDQQQRLGGSVEQSAEIVGRALQSPSQAMAALGRQGFKLEADQQRLLKQLEATGRMAEAQAIIMDMLTEAYGGSAAAARMNTAAGLWKRLTDRIGDFASRVANSGAFEFMQRKLLEVADTLDEMANDGRLDRLAEALSTAFIDAAERAEEFAKKLLDIDFSTLTNDASRWLDDFGEKLDTAGRWITMITAPFRVLVNVVTGGISAIGVAFTGLITASLSGMALVARAIPDAFGGQKIVAGLESARDTALSMMQLLAGQVAQDGRDIAATWNSVAEAAEGSADRQARAAAKAAEDTRKSMQKTGEDIASFFRSNITTLEQALAAITFAETAADLAEIEKALADSKLTTEELGAAMEALGQRRGFVTVAEDAKRTTTELEQLRKEQARLKAEYDAGNITLQQWQDGHNAAAEAIRKLESESAKATGTIKAVGRELKTLTDVQRAISDAKTDRDIAAIRTALQGLYNTGQVTAAQYNTELAKLSTRQKELAQALQGSKKAQDEKNDADRDAIRTSEDLRRESGRRMEAERKASGEAMVRRRKDGDDAKRDMSAMEGFFGGVMSRAREGAAGLSRAALEAFEALRGIQSAAPEIDTSGLEDTRRSLERVTKALGDVQAAASSPMVSSLGRWALETQRDSLKTQQAFLAQKASLQSLMNSYERGAISAQRFVKAAQGMRSTLGLLDDSDLSALESAIDAANQRMQQMGDSTRSTLESLQDELDGLQGRTDDIERRRFAARQRELQAQLAEAQAGGDAQAVANASRALGLLRQIESESAQQRQAEEQKKRMEAQQATQPAAQQPAQAPGKVIRLEAPGRAPVDVRVASDADETNLLGILEQYAQRSL